MPLSPNPPRNIIMNNKGQANHKRFRTKFWQERYSQPLQQASFIDANVIQGTRISRTPFRNPAILIDPPIDGSPIPLRKGSAASSRRDSRMALKL